VKLSEDLKVKIVDDIQRGTFRYTTRIDKEALAAELVDLMQTDIIFFEDFEALNLTSKKRTDAVENKELYL